MRVIYKKTGQLGNIPDDKFDPNLFEQATGKVNVQKAQIEGARPIPQAVGPKPGFIETLAKGIVEPASRYAGLVGESALQVAKGTFDPAYRKALQGRQNQMTPEEIERVGKMDATILPDKIGEVGLGFTDKQMGDRGEILRGGVKRTAGGMSYAIPGGATVGQALVRGGAAGALSAGSADEATLDDIGKGAAFGGIAGGAGKIIGKAVNKLSGGVDDVGNSIEKTIVKPKVAASPFAIEEEGTIIRSLNKLGLTGSAQEIRKKTPEAFRKLSEEIEQELAAKNASVLTSDVVTTFDDAVRGNINFDESLPSYTKASEKYMNQLVNQANKGEVGTEIGIDSVFKLKQNLGRQLSRAFDKAEKGMPLTPQEEVGMSVWSSLDDLISNAVPEVTEKTRLQSYLYKAAPGLQKSSQGTWKVPLINAEVSNQGMQKVASGVSRAGQATAGFVDNLNPEQGLERVGRAAGIAANNYSMQSQPEEMAQDQIEETMLPEASAMDTQLPQEEATYTPSPDGQWQTNDQTGEVVSMDGQWKFDPQADDWVPNEGGQQDDIPSEDQFKQAYNEAFQLGDTKSMKRIEEAMKFFHSKDGGGKPLSATAQVSVTKANSALSSLGRIEQDLNNNPNAMVEVMNPFSQTGRQIGGDITSIIDIIGFFRTGAALSEDQRKDYHYMFPDKLDSSETKKRKMNAIREELSGYASIGTATPELAPTMVQQ